MSAALRPISCVALLVALVPFAPLAQARAPQDLAEIQREARIARNVFHSAFRSEWQDDLRVSSVDVEYLASQGVLVTVRVGRPWITLREDGEQSIRFDGHLSIGEIPRMVEDILNNVGIPIDPYQPEALEDLRALREEQRELRLESREIRAGLRVKRRELVRADDEKTRAAVKAEIDELERELAAVDAQYDALREDIDAQMDLIAELHRQPQETARADEPSAIETTVVKVACDYGATLKSLDADHFVSFVIRQGERNHYLVFKMDHVQGCARGDMTAERLLELGYQYSS